MKMRRRATECDARASHQVGFVATVVTARRITSGGFLHGQQGERPFAARGCSATRENRTALFRCRTAAAGGGCGGGSDGGVAAPHVAAVLTSRPSRVTTVAASGSSILTTVHPDGLCFGVCRR